MAEPSVDPAPDALVRKWLAEIETAEADKDRQRWLKRCKAIEKIYREQQDANDPSAPRSRKRMALLWSNIQTLAPAVYARTPQAVVTRRFKDEDPAGRVASEALERALNFSIDESDFATAMLGVRDEFLLFGFGQMWVRYVPTLSTVQPPTPQAPTPTLAPPDGAQDVPLQVADDPEPYEVVSWEEVVADRLHHSDFFHNPARSWAEVTWVARRVFLTREELVKRFPDCGSEVPLDWSPTDKKDSTEADKKGAIYEIWDLASKSVIWISRGYVTQPLDHRADPLGLRGFFPCPRPVLGTVGPSSLVPIPDFIYWQDQADEINVLTARIDSLINALKVRGFYSASQKDNLNALLSGDDSTMIPVDSWAALGDKGGIKGIIDWFPLDQVAGALKQCIATRTQIIEDVYQITGISDIQRGDSDPDETATAASLKATWGSSRVRERQKEIARFARDVLRIMGEVIATKFGPDVLGKMTGVNLLTDQQKQQVQQAMQAAQAGAQQAQAMGRPPPPPPPIPPQVGALMQQPSWDDVEAILRNPELRAFRIDIETDSTVEPNDQEEKQRRIEFVTAVGKYLAESLPVVTQAPQMLPVIAEGLKYLVRGFRAGREMEDTIDRALDQLTQAAQQPQQPPPPDPAEQAKAQAQQAHAQAANTAAQAHVMQAQNDQQANQIEAAKVASNHQIEMAGVQAENNRTQAELAANMHEAVVRAMGRQLGREVTSTAPIQAPTR